jgi:hypothetical protein
VTGQPITSGVRAALDVGRRSLITAAAPYGPATDVVLALDAAGLLQDPETAAELVRLRKERAALNDIVAGADKERGLLRARLAELAPYETLHAQACPTGLHREWFADRPGLLCPWCGIARLQGGREEVYRVEREGVEVATYATMQAAGDHCETALRTELPGAVTEWISSPDDSGVLDLITHHGGHTSATGWTLRMVEVRAEFDPVTPAVTG